MTTALYPVLSQFAHWLQQPVHLWKKRHTHVAEHARIQGLNKHETLTLARPEHTQIECFEGCVWVTQDGDQRDVLLESGQTLWVDQPARMLIHALESSKVCIQPSFK